MRNRLDRSPIHLFHRVSQCSDELFLSELPDLTPRQLAVPTTIAQHEGGSQTDLVGHTNIDRSTLADIVKRLAKKGLLQRRRTKEDARAYAVKLTDEGRRVLRSAEPLAKKVEDHILAALPAGRRERFMRELQTIIGALEQSTNSLK